MSIPTNGYTPSVRKIRQVLDPATLNDPNAEINRRRTNQQDFQQQFTADVIQKRIDAQKQREAEAEKKRQQEILAAQQRANASTEARNKKYAEQLAQQQKRIDALIAQQAVRGNGNEGDGQYPGVKLDLDAFNLLNHTAQYQRALEWANKQVTNPSRDWTRDCQMFARSAVGAKAFGTTALQAWQLTPDQNKHYTYPPRPGSIAYYANPKNPGAGHAVFVGDNGKVYSTDIKRTGKIDIVNWNVFQKTWGMQYLGWIDTTPSGRLPVQGPRSNTK